MSKRPVRRSRQAAPHRPGTAPALGVRAERAPVPGPEALSPGGVAMRVSPRKFLVLALAVALPVAFCRRPPEPPAGPVVPAPATEAVVLRVLAKGQLALDVAARRRSLFEAAALFRELNRRPPAPARPAGLDPTLR